MSSNKRNNSFACSGSTPARSNNSFTNAKCPTSVIETVAEPDAAGRALLHDAADAMQLSARAYHRVLKLSRTIADLAGVQQITPTHLAEALQYRPKLQIM